MDGLQHYHAPHLSAQPQAILQPPPDPASVKTPADYLKALRRRFWVVLMVGVPLGVAVTVWVIKQPATYTAEATISIVAPQSDPEFSTLVSKNGVRRDSPAMDRYFMDRVNRLKSRGLAERVVYDPMFLQGSAPPGEEAVEELLNNLHPTPFRNSNYVRVTLDGTDPARVAKQLDMLLTEFAKEAKLDAERKIDGNKTNLGVSLDKLKNDLQKINEQVTTMLAGASFIGPGGTNILQTQYESLGAMLVHKQMRLADAQTQAWVGQMFPKLEADPEAAERRHQIGQLENIRRRLTLQLQEHKRGIRNFESDPSVKTAANRLTHVMDQIEELKQPTPRAETPDGSELVVNSLREELSTAETTSKALLDKIRESIPEHQRYLALQDERELKIKQIYDLQTNKSEYDMLASSLDPPVAVVSAVTEPTKPAKSGKTLKVLLALAFSLGLGVALVCLFEHLDHSVKVPEHLTVGLTLPLLGVVPRIRRTALVNRGSHLWTPGDPGSVEADAYRNLRASLLGVADRIGALKTLLVTSAKAGEGKSTTALNVAATCARAGERVLLMDVDLRRPSLADVFPKGHGLGLVDALRGEAPWQRAVVRTELPNLDFLPTGDARDVPIEVLSTFEMRQLLLALSGHYDRVILDGPAVLGMADCRILGRVVDAAVLVVRSGSHEMRPLQRAKAMLEQSHVVIAGVVFNGLSDDLQNWSSYGPYTPYSSGGPVPRAARLSASDAHALPLAAVEG